MNRVAAMLFLIVAGTAMSSGEELRVDQGERFYYCVIGNIVDGTVLSDYRGSLVSKCMVEVPPTASNAEVEELLDAAIAAATAYRDDAFDSGVEAESRMRN